MTDPRDYKLEISSLQREKSPAAPAKNIGKPFLSVLFACCNVYQHIYKSADGSCYAGHCPRCAKPVRIEIGEGGTTARHFVVD